MGVYDQAARYTAKLNPADFLRWLVPAFVKAWAYRDWLDTRTLPFPGEPDRTCDTVAGLVSLSGEGPPAALVVEFQSEPEAAMLERLAEYILRVRREVPAATEAGIRYEVAGALLNLTGPVQLDAWDMAPPGLGGSSRFQVTLKTMRRESAVLALLGIAEGHIDRCILPWIPLMADGSDAVILNVWKCLASEEPDRRLRAVYGGLALIFAELAGRTAAWKKALEDWNVRESQIVLEWQAEARAETKRADLLQFLQSRFGEDLPADLVARINEEKDFDRLQKWFTQSLAAHTLADVRAAVLPS